MGTAAAAAPLPSSVPPARVPSSPLYIPRFGRASAPPAWRRPALTTNLETQEMAPRMSHAHGETAAAAWPYTVSWHVPSQAEQECAANQDRELPNPFLKPARRTSTVACLVTYLHQVPWHGGQCGGQCTATCTAHATHSQPTAVFLPPPTLHPAGKIGACQAGRLREAGRQRAKYCQSEAQLARATLPRARTLVTWCPCIQSSKSTVRRPTPGAAGRMAGCHVRVAPSCPAAQGASPHALQYCVSCPPHARPQHSDSAAWHARQHVCGGHPAWCRAHGVPHGPGSASTSATVHRRTDAPKHVLKPETRTCVPAHTHAGIHAPSQRIVHVLETRALGLKTRRLRCLHRLPG